MKDKQQIDETAGIDVPDENSSDEQLYAGDEDHEDVACQAGEPAEGEGEEASINDESASAALSMTARISAMLFVSPKPLSVKTLAEALRVKPETVERALRQVEALYDDQVHGFSLVEVAGGFQLRTAPAAKYAVQRLIPPKAKRLTRAAAETLAVVAYKQPVQRAEIEAIRGVDALPTIKTLLEARLIRIVGRETSAGQPALYGTTQTFLDKFGMKDLSELPSPRELSELAAEPGDVDEIESEEFEPEASDAQAAVPQNNVSPAAQNQGA